MSSTISRLLSRLLVFLIPTAFAIFLPACGGGPTRPADPPTDTDKIVALMSGTDSEIHVFVEEMLLEHKTDSSISERKLSTLAAVINARSAEDPNAGILMNKILSRVADRPWFEQAAISDSSIMNGLLPVLTESMTVAAATVEDSIIVETFADFKRVITWGGCERHVFMLPLARTSNDVGTVDLYFPGPSGHWKECGGVDRAVITEKHLRFATKKEALEWLRTLTGFRHHGMKGDVVIAWGADPSKKTLNIGIWKLHIGKKKNRR